MSISKKLLNIKLLLSVFAAVMLTVLALVSAGCSTSAADVNNNQPSAQSSHAVVVSSAPLYDEEATVSLYEQSIPAVVQVESTVAVTSKLPSPFGLQIPNQQGLGSGFMIDAEGHILTNYHVVDQASRVKVVLSDGTELNADVIGTDKHNDLALLKIDTSSLANHSYLVMGDSAKVRPGQMAIALGSPFGLQGSVTVGVISGTGRSLPGSALRTITNIIQTDAAINPGNSGGPLLNSSGEVIGINTAIEADGAGVGFAVPINTAKTLLPELLKGGAVKTAWLGIEGMPVDRELVDELGLKVEKGVYVLRVLEDSPAEQAGLVEGGKDANNKPLSGGDVIIAVDNVQVSKVQDLLTFFNNKHPGDTVTLSIQRGDQQISIPAKLGEWPENLDSMTSTFSVPNGGQGEGNEFDFGPFHFRIK